MKINFVVTYNIIFFSKKNTCIQAVITCDTLFEKENMMVHLLERFLHNILASFAAKFTSY